MEESILNKQILEFVNSFLNNKTKLSYSKTLNDFGEYLIANKIDSISNNTIIDYQKFLRTSEYSPRSYVTKTQIVRRFFKIYYPDFAKIDDIAFHQDKVREIASKYIPNISFYAILNHAQKVYGFHLEKLFRFFVVARLFMETGIRVEEIISIRCDELELSKKIINIGGKRKRSLYISDVLSLEIETYLKIKYYKSSYLISNLKYGEQITTRQIERIMEEVEDKFTPRDFRHTFMCNKRFLGKTFHEISDMVGGIPLHTVNYLSDKVQILIQEGKVNIYKPKAISDVWILHVINTIVRFSQTSEKLIQVKDFGTSIKIRGAVLNRLLRFVFRFPANKAEKRNPHYFIDDMDIVNSLTKYYSLKGRHESPKIKEGLGFKYDEWLKNGREPQLGGDLKNSIKELPTMKFNEDVTLWQKDNVQRRLRGKRYEYTLYDVDFVRKKTWFIIKTEETKSILFAASNFPCLLFNEKIPKAKSFQAKENQLIKQRIFYGNSTKYKQFDTL